MKDPQDLTLGTGRRFHTPAVVGDPQYYDVHDSTGVGIASSSVVDDTVNTGDCCDDLAVCDSERTALQQENTALSGENEALQEEVEDGAEVGGGGETQDSEVFNNGVRAGDLSVNIICNRVEENATESGKYTRYHWVCTWNCSQSEWQVPPQNLAGGTNLRTVWVDNLGVEKYATILISGTTPGATGTSPWKFLAASANSSSCTFYTDISPFTSNLTATIYNTVRFEIRANATYGPRSPYKPVLYRQTGNGSQTNGTTIDPDA